MSALDVQNEILEPMQRVFLPPRRMEAADEQAALRDYVEALEQFGNEDLGWAWRKVRETHVTRSWPLPAQFFKAASENRRDRRESSGGHRKGQGPSQTELWERWKSVSRSPLAYEAVKRGVAWTLKCAVLYGEKKPEQCDLREFTAQKESAARTRARIEAGERLEFKGRILPPFAGEDRLLVLSMYANIQMQETRTQAEISYGVKDTADE